MTPKKLLLSIFMSIHIFAWSQSVSINNDGSVPDNSAMLDINSTTKGLLIPRMTEAQRNLITSPAAGLMIYQTDGVSGYYYNAGNAATPAWTALSGGSQWLNNSSKIYYNSDFVGIGTNDPLAALHIRRDQDAFTGLIIENAQFSTNSGERISFKNEEGELAGIALYDAVSSFGSAMTIFNDRSLGHIRLNTGGNTRMYIGNNGRVGIGVNLTAPAGLLHVQNPEWASNPVLLENTSPSSVGPTLRFSTPGHSYDIIGSTGTGAPPGAGYFGIYDNTANAYRFLISSAGEVAIGASTTSAGSRFYVESSETSVATFYNTFSGTSSHYGIYSLSANRAGYGLGIRAEGGYMGGYFEANASSYNGSIYGVYGTATGTGGLGTRYGIYGAATGGATNYAGYFAGDVHVAGTLSKAAGTFKIDHPQDPANKTLSHSFVESPDMLNLYTGNVVTGADGVAIAQLPGYFEALNIDYTYQLTVVGQFAQAIVLKKIQGNQFVIKTDKPNVEVSWMVTGIRNDPYARRNRVVPEEDKKGDEKGKYLNPEVYDLPASKAIHPPPTRRETF